ncbi:hypothetical protein [Xanthomonas campestris]|uniref:hypothetical protein n=1 Tax=Xanthomonas campestris TaxID=339 RepID=UPI001CD7B6CF|nr:hypothetical protein [Xanthomonas campestris]
MQWMQRLGLVAMLGMLSIGQVAARTSEAAEQVEASMNVAGELTLTPDGTVTAVTLINEDSLPPAVRSRIRQSIAGWRFDPVTDSGTALPTTLPMRLLLVAKPGEKNQYLVSIRSAHFGGEASDGSSVRAKDMTPPSYPKAAFQDGATGIVYLLLKIGRDGKVADLVAEQVNLTVSIPAAKRERVRKMLADASIAKARTWTFDPPSDGPERAAPYWTMRVPVSFDITDSIRDLRKRQASWRSYLPGPRQSAPWSEQGVLASATDSPDALPDSGLFSVRGEGVRLLTPLQGG